MIKKIVFLAFYLSLALIMTIGQLGIIRIGIVSFNIVTVLLVVMIIHMRKWGILMGVYIGFGSWFASLIYGSLLFVYFDIAVLPRILVGVVLYFIYLALGKLNILKVAILGFLAAFLNTTFVSAFIFLHNAISPLSFFEKNLNNNPFVFWISVIWINATVEFLAIPVASVALWPLANYLNKKTFSNLGY
ncbi:ECF transporter S component [Mycoplasmopsis ciconiae]|uniref:ECF transporter S component n=1 Tax=Mycoplasmopsis ciconiae TaxID=561067 RepID=A0ABU7MLA0_9BACT|nr:ECF transporter S component [Mycoplasmopsis ciconiae]